MLDKPSLCSGPALFPANKLKGSSSPRALAKSPVLACSERGTCKDDYPSYRVPVGTARADRFPEVVGAVSWVNKFT